MMRGGALSSVISKLNSGAVTSLELIRNARERILESNRDLNALISVVDWELAERLASDSDQRRRKGRAQSPIDGVPIAIKDNFCTKLLPTTCASKMLQDFRPPYNATVVDLLLNRAGAIMIGKTNMDEFGMGSWNQHSHFGPCFNAFRDANGEKRVAGGSSGGSAVAVGAGFCPIALGSDTGGSVRLPAAYNGVIGFKPSYGRLSRHGLISYAPSLDTVGLIGDSVESVSQMFDVLDTYDPQDPASVENRKNGGQMSMNQDDDRLPLKGFIIGIANEYFPTEVFATESMVPAVIEHSVRTLERLGAEVRIVSIPTIPKALPCYYILATAEASSELARYDGIRYGHRSASDPILHSKDESTEDSMRNQIQRKLESMADVFALTRSEGFGEEVKRRIETGTFVLSAASYDVYYRRAQTVRSMIERDFCRVFRHNHLLHAEEGEVPKSASSQERVDFILAPVAVGGAPNPTSSTQPIDEYLNDVFTVPSSLAGLPSIAVPVKSLKDSDGMPVAVQFIGQYGTDHSLLSFAKRLTQFQ